jgi:cell fate regulator YaaT (PSP1 superfamily)
MRSMEDDFVGVWLGSDKFIGYLQDNKITFKTNDDVQVKTIELNSLLVSGK